MSTLLHVLLDHSYTVTDLHRRIRLLQQVLESILFAEQEELRTPDLEMVRKEISDRHVAAEDQLALSRIPEPVWHSFTAATLATKIEALLAESDSLPVMTLYIPVAFNEEQLSPLSAWVRREVEAGILFDVHVDPRVVGGCAFVYKDRHFDWSLRRYLRAKRGMVTSLLNAYGH